MAKSLRAPVRLIASNAGVEGDVIIEKLLGKPFEIGYNAVRALVYQVALQAAFQTLIATPNLLPLWALKTAYTGLSFPNECFHSPASGMR